MRLSERVVLIILGYLVFWLFPVKLVNWKLDVKIRDAEQILQGHMVLWVHHNTTICGCLSMEKQRIICDCNDRYLKDDTIVGWAKGNHIP
jgi:hypothetical protein